MLCINNKDHDALISILPPIPQELVDKFFNSLQILFPDFVKTDTKHAGFHHSFPAIHCDIYGQYSNRVSLSLIIFALVADTITGRKVPHLTLILQAFRRKTKRF